MPNSGFTWSFCFELSECVVYIFVSLSPDGSINPFIHFFPVIFLLTVILETEAMADMPHTSVFLRTSQHPGVKVPWGRGTKQLETYIGVDTGTIVSVSVCV